MTTYTGTSSKDKFAGADDREDYLIYGYDGDDTLIGNAGNDTLIGGKGNDNLTGGDGSDVFVYANGDGNDVIYDYAEEDIISLTSGTVNYAGISGDDAILTVGKGRLTLKGAAGKYFHFKTADDDFYLPYRPKSEIEIASNGKGATLTGVFADDEVNVNTHSELKNLVSTLVTIDASAVDHDIAITGNAKANVILGGAGDDSIWGGKGNDTLQGGTGKDVFVYANGDGNDLIVDYAEEDIININSGTVSKIVRSGNDLIFTVGKGKISLINAADKTVTWIDSAGENTYPSSSGGGGSSNSKLITGTNGADSIHNTISGVTINALGGNDSILNGEWETEGIVSKVSISGGAGNDYIDNTGDSVTIDGGADNDYISNYDGSNVSITSGDGDDAIYNGGGYKVTIDAGLGNDEIRNWGSNVTIDGGAGDEYIENHGSNVTINGGTGKDDIRIEGSSVTIDGGDDNDSIYNWCSTSTISGGDGNDTILNNCYREDDGSIHYDGDNGDNGKKIVFKYTSGDGNDIVYGFKADSTLSISGGSYSTVKSGKNIIVTVGNGKITLVGAASLSKINITGTKAVTETNTWKLNGTTATYGTTSKTLVTVKGVQSTSGLTIDTSKKIVTVAQAALNNSNVTVSNGYTLALANNVDKKATTSTDWSYKDSVATYAQTTTAYYTLAGNKKSITYKKATSKNLAKISGVTSKSGLSVSGNVITVPNKIIGKNVTVNGKGYKFKFAANNTAITGSGNADKIINSGAKVTITGGKGNDIISLSSAAKNNVISYNNGDGNDIIYGLTADDTIKIAKGKAATSTSGDDVIFTVGKGKITVKGAKNKTFTYSDAEGNKTYSTVVAPSPDDGGDYTVSNDGKGITLSSSYAEKSFDVSEVRGGSAIVTINASLTNGLDITGNDKANYIIGGKGNDTIDGGNDKENDTLTGGKGADIFFYSNGNGNDVITDYEAKDIIKIAKGSSVSDISSSNGRDVVLKVGKGSITVKNAAKKNIGVTYVEDGIEYGYLDGMKTLNIAKKTNDTIATLSKSYWEDSFDATKLGNEDVGKSITQIDASAVTRTLKITGNDRANTILGSSTKSNTITGGGGDDTLQGGTGADVFVYTAGDGNDSIIGYNDNDIISIASGTANYTVNANNDLVLTVGTGKIILENAGGKKLNYYDDEHRTTPYSALTSANSRSNVWLDDNYELTPDLSSIVQNKSVDYSSARTSTELNKETNLIAYSGKK